jgi:hypothetical protein
MSVIQVKFPRLSKGSTGKRVSMIQYLTETLGLKYFPRSAPQAVGSVLSSPREWLEPSKDSRLLFVLTDQQDLNWSNAHEIVYQNMIKALGLKFHEVYKYNLVDLSQMDYFSKLRQLNCDLPTVFFSQDPDFSGGVKSLGSHNWVEIYSFTEMMKRPELKKVSWKTLQILQAQGF